MWKYVAELAYRGTEFCGWQRQKGSVADKFPSVQAEVEAVLRRVTSEPALSVVGSGRTDSGVHATGQVAHFIIRTKEWDPAILQKGMNSLLPNDIQALAVRPVKIEFHAQKSALRKQYSYYFQQGPCAIPHLEPYSWWIRKTLDREALKEALSYLVGEHDFLPFRASGAKPGPSVRRILEAECRVEPVLFPAIAPYPGLELVRIRLMGTGFLKQMVRGIVGTLLQIGEGRRNPACIREILESRDRKAVGPTAPARGLWLERVWYPEDLYL